MPIIDLFSGEKFKQTIQKYCDSLQLVPEEITNDEAILVFQMESGREQSLNIYREDTLLEFSVQSMLVFDDPAAIPHEISTMLLRRNTEGTVGFWCIEEIEDTIVYTYMHNVEFQMLNEECFQTVVGALVQEVEDLENILLELGENADELGEDEEGEEDGEDEEWLEVEEDDEEEV